jgi:hypothetical protein
MKVISKNGINFLELGDFGPRKVYLVIDYDSQKPVLSRFYVEYEGQMLEIPGCLELCRLVDEKFPKDLINVDECRSAEVRIGL